MSNGSRVNGESRVRDGSRASDERISRPSLTDRLASRVQRRLVRTPRLAAIVDDLRHRAVPNHWTTLFGVVSMACVVVLMVTGVFLMFFYTPSSTVVVYEGTYAPLLGAEMSKALASTLGISFDVPGGLLMRQAHHWAALLLPAALIMQLLTTYFTGAFRRPRLWSWVLLFLVYIVALVGGWSGYALPDDMLSGTGLRIVEGVVLGIPLLGTQLKWMLFGGEFPGQAIEHLYPIHVAVMPVLLVVLLVVRTRIAYRLKPPQFAGQGRTDANVVGSSLLPSAAARAGGLLLIVIGLLFLISATMTISPIWLYGPASPGDASAGSQPDWYTGFLDGALRLVPPGWEFEWLGATWSLAVLVPLAVVTAFFGLVVGYPFIEAWVSGDRREHHLLDRPRNTPSRTGIGVAGMVFYGTLWGAASADLIATHFSLSIEAVVTCFQVALLVGPAAGFTLAKRVCLALQKKDRDTLLHGFETGRIVRLPGGEYIEIHQAVDAEARSRLTAVAAYAPLELRPDDRGVITPTQRVRARLSQFLFEDRIEPVASQDHRIPVEAAPSVGPPEHLRHSSL